MIGMLLAALMFTLLLAIAFAHILWAFGNSWPIRDEAMLIRTVIGRPGIKRMPRLGSFGVGVAVLLAGIIALALADHTAGGAGLTTLGILTALLFAGRGALGYTSWWQARTPLEPFRTLDRRNYSPLCLGLAAGYAGLILMRVL